MDEIHHDDNNAAADVLFSADDATTVGAWAIRGLSYASTKGPTRRGDGSISTAALLATITIIAFAFIFCFCMHAINLRRDEARDDAAAAAAAASAAAEEASTTTDPFNEMTRKERRAYIDKYLKTKNFSLDISKHIRVKGVWATATSMNEPSSPSARTTESSDRQCLICFEDFRDSDEIGWSVECSHYYHGHCIRSWLMKNPECPCCRRRFLNNELTLDEDSSSDAEGNDVEQAIESTTSESEDDSTSA